MYALYGVRTYIQGFYVPNNNKLNPSLTCNCSSEALHDLCPLSVCSVSLPHSLHLNPVSGARLEGGQSVGGVTVSRLGDRDGAILGGVGHSEGVALGVAGRPGDTQSGGCNIHKL